MRLARPVLVVCILGIAAIVPLFLESRVTVGQQQNFPQPNRKPACTCFCGDGTFNSFNLFPKAAQLAGKCYGGPLPADYCGTEVASFPPEEIARLCREAKESGKDCPALRGICKDSSQPTGKGCSNPSTPWFGPAPDCKDVRAPQVAAVGDNVTVSVCGYRVFSHKNSIPNDKLGLSAYLDAMRDHILSQVGSRVCCDRFREAARTGNPCDPKTDIDCDGKPNATDVTKDDARFPDINLFTRQSNGSIDPFPPGLNPDDQDFLPDSTARDSKGVGECPCQWELITGKLACSPDGRAKHVYTATWKCPANGKEVFTTKYVDADRPCKEYKGAALSLFLFDYSQDDPLGTVTLSIGTSRSCY